MQNLLQFLFNQFLLEQVFNPFFIYASLGAKIEIGKYNLFFG